MSVRQEKSGQRKWFIGKDMASANEIMMEDSFETES